MKLFVGFVVSGKILTCKNMLVFFFFFFFTKHSQKLIIIIKTKN